MPKAVLHGELHTSAKDDSLLQDHGFDRFDAVMRESMDQTFRWQPDPFYLLLFAGMKLYLNTLQNIFFVGKEELFAAAQSADADPYRLDISLKDWNRKTSFSRKLIVASLSAFLSLSIVSGFAVIPIIVIPAFIVLFPLLYFLYIGVLTVRIRDRLMVDRIQKFADREGYDTVLVSVGDAHVDGMRTLLEEQGWEVEAYRSTSWFAKPIRVMTDVLNRL